METTEVKFSPVKLSLLMLLTLVFVIGGILIISVADDLRGEVIGWSSILFFGFGSLVFGFF